MGSHAVKTDSGCPAGGAGVPPDVGQLSRREIICAAGAATLGLITAPALADELPHRVQPPDSPWWMGPEFPTARIVDVRSAKVLSGTSVEPYLLNTMIDEAVQLLTRAPSVERAWRQILGNAEKIAIKFNSVGAKTIATNDAFAAALVGRLAAAGVAPDRIALIEVSPELVERLGTRRPATGWGKTISVGGRAEPLANYLLEADAIINVPFLKTHQIAGLSGCMKNISHAVIRRPARYHANGCSPYVAEVIGAAEVRNRLRLQLVNSLRVVIDRGPDAAEGDIAAWGGIFAARDPVAMDFIGRATIEALRRERGLSSEIEVPYLRAAADAGLGRWRPAEIDRVSSVVDG